MTPEQSLKNQTALSIYKVSITRYIRSRLSLLGWQYSHLAAALEDHGVYLTPENLRNKVSRGTLAADLLILLMDVLGDEQTYTDINHLVASLKKE